MESQQAVPSPVSTGSGGVTFEHKVQTEFLCLMISRGVVRIRKFERRFEIEKIAFQTRYQHIETDDMVVTFKPKNGVSNKIFSQMKLTIRLGRNELFKSVLDGFWKDFNSGIFSKENDVFALIMGPPTNAGLFDTYNSLLDLARNSLNHLDFYKKISPFKKYMGVYNELCELLCEVNNNNSITDEETWIFLKTIYILSYDYNMDSISRDYTSIIRVLDYTKRRVEGLEEASSVWNNLFVMVCEGNFKAGDINSSFVFDKYPELKGWFDPQIIDINPIKSAMDNQRKIMIDNLDANTRLDSRTKSLLLSSIDEVYSQLEIMDIDTFKHFLNLYQHPRNNKYSSSFAGVDELFEILTYINCKIKNWSLNNNELANLKISTGARPKWVQLIYSTQKSTFPMVIMNLGLELYDNTPNNDYFKYRWIIENVNTDLDYENLCELCGIGQKFPFSRILSDFSYANRSSYFEDVPKDDNSFIDLGNIRVCCTKCLRKIRELKEQQLEDKLKEVLLID